MPTPPQQKPAFGCSSPRDAKAGSRLEAASSRPLTDPTKYKPKQHTFGHELGSKPRSVKGTLSTGKRPDPFAVNKSLKEDIVDREPLNHTARLDAAVWNKQQTSRKASPFGTQQDRFKERVTPPSPCVGHYRVDGPEKFLSTNKSPTTAAKSRAPFGATSPRPVLAKPKTTPTPSPGAYTVP